MGLLDKAYEQSKINSLDSSKNIAHTFYQSRKNQLKKMGNDPEVSFLKDDKLESVGNLIKDQWYDAINKYILKFLKKENMEWYNGWNGYAFPKFIIYNNIEAIINLLKIYSI